jgi:hypothetical protein
MSSNKPPSAVNTHPVRGYPAISGALSHPASSNPHVLLPVPIPITRGPGEPSLWRGYIDHLGRRGSNGNCDPVIARSGALVNDACTEADCNCHT